ncbi:pseudouridine synthase domain-containing protein [Phanerochaete sordida]|uniref:Pseudouridine synthase domain-containing protein n=1 Tax=Phanerochaete sordida TaxID=48140 RepID=A0A9P3GPW5_9APHY|nr:pseudouridine synthase domain-containing protein [Phanerochaete sordida]
MSRATKEEGKHQDSAPEVILTDTGLRKVKPYWYNYTTMAKGRWLGREILEIISTEFRDRSMEYYRYALKSKITTINGKVAKPDTIVENGDRIENVAHRHEPPVTSTPVRIVHHDKERDFIVIDKPGSIPVHAAGRYYKQSLVQILKTELGFEHAYTINRLDRLTSGLMIIPLNAKLAHKMAEEFAAGTVRKEYVARCKGKFPEGDTVCEEPLLTIDRQMGLNVVHPDGKHAKTIFTLLHYDEETDSSVLHCKPVTGRSHQIRVHLQYLGYPIANDPVYSDETIWGRDLGKGGVDVIPSDERAAPQAPPEFQFAEGENPEALSDKPSLAASSATEGTSQKLLPRETGHDIGMGSPVPLSAEAVQIITRLRNQKDKDEDWGRWRDVVFRAKGRLRPKCVPTPPPLPPQNRRRRGGPVDIVVDRPVEGESGTTTPDSAQVEDQLDSEALPPAAEALHADGAIPGMTGPVVVEDVELVSSDAAAAEPGEPSTPQLSDEEALAKIAVYPADGEEVHIEKHANSEQLKYCPECYLPLHPDPKPEKLYIFLHALRYTTSLGCFETEMPAWAAKGFTWDRA